MIHASRLARPLISMSPGTDLQTILLPGPGPGQWELLRAPAPPVPGQAGDLRENQRRPGEVFVSLEAAALELVPGEPFVFEVPLELGLIQRFVLPAAEPAEIEEMARIQLEKILPYPADAVGLTFGEIARSETEVILAVEALHHDRLEILCQPLTSRGCWPARVLFHLRAVAAALGGIGGNAMFICGESGKFVLGIAESGRLSFAQALGGGSPAEIAAELPAVLLGAELEGLPAELTALRLDSRCAELRGALNISMGVPVEIFDAGVAAVPVAAAESGDLSPPGWRTERLRIAGQVRLKRRLMAAAGVYIGLLVLGVLALVALKIRLVWLESQNASVRPASEAAQAAELRWRNLGPAIDPSHYAIETLFQVSDCLPPGDSVRLTSFDASLDSINIQGEAPTPAAAVEFTEKLKARPELRKFHLKSEPPAIVPGHVRLRIGGTTSATF